MRRTFRGSPAAREFFRLQWLQKAGIPAPRAVALLNGFTLNEQRGDAVILEAIEPSVPLDALLTEAELEGRAVAGHRSLAAQVIEIVHALGKAGLGHDDLHLGNFLVLHALIRIRQQRAGLTAQGADHALAVGHAMQPVIDVVSQQVGRVGLHAVVVLRRDAGEGGQLPVGQRLQWKAALIWNVHQDRASGCAVDGQLICGRDVVLFACLCRKDTARKFRQFNAF